MLLGHREFMLSMCEAPGSIPQNPPLTKKESMKHKWKWRIADGWGIVVHAYGPSTQDAEAGGLRIGRQPGLSSKTLSQQQQKNV
jgi:hypothetical protein